jgi:hypothetical protein
LVALSEVNASIYAKGQVPAIEHVQMTIEEEAQGLAAKIRKTEGGQRDHSIGVLQGELRILARNKANGYSGWEFRESVLLRALELLGVMQ